MPLRLKKPAAPAWAHALLAACLWTAVGGALGTFGVLWALGGGSAAAPYVLAGAVLVGLAKGAFVLGKTAARNVARIEERGDGKCLGGFLSWRSWLLVGAMIALGRLLRGGLLSTETVGFVYAAIGVALLAGSVVLWRGFARLHARPRSV